MGLRPDLNELSALGHHASKYNWGIQFVSLPSAVTGFTSADLNTRCLSISAPTRTQQASEVNLRGNKVYQHAIMDYSGTIDLTMHETVDRKTLEFFERWMDLQWTPIAGASIPKSTNQAVFLLSLLDSEDKKRKYYTIFGAWPKTISPVTYDSTSSDVVQYTVQFQYDYYLLGG